MKPFEYLPLVFIAVASALIGYNISDFQHNVHNSKESWLRVLSSKLGGHDVNCQTINTVRFQEINITCTSLVNDEKAVQAISQMPNVILERTSMSGNKCKPENKKVGSCNYDTTLYSAHTSDGDSLSFISVPKELQNFGELGYLTLSRSYNIWRGP